MCDIIVSGHQYSVLLVTLARVKFFLAVTSFRSLYVIVAVRAVLNQLFYIKIAKVLARGTLPNVIFKLSDIRHVFVSTSS